MTKKYLRDDKGNIIGIEKKDWKRPLNVITGNLVHLDPILQERLDRQH